MDAKERRKLRHEVVRMMLATHTWGVVRRVWKVVWLMEERGYTKEIARKKTKGIDVSYPRHAFQLYGLRRSLLLKSRGENKWETLGT